MASAERYDAATGTWSPAGSMASSRQDHTATKLDGPSCRGTSPPGWCGKVLVAGGAASAVAELFDPQTGTWSQSGPLATPRSMHTATLLDGSACTGAVPPAWCGKVLVTGGQTTTGPSARLTSAELYDPDTGEWSATGSLADPRREHASLMLPSGKVLSVGGQGKDLTTLSTTELYDPIGGQWEPAGDLLVGRNAATATLLPDGRPLVAGGRDHLSAPRRVSEIYSPSSPSGPWIDGGPMNTKRAFHTATPLSNGQTLVAGAEPSQPELRSAEVYDPATASWSPVPPMNQGRGRHTATLLTGPGCGSSCGQVLVVGGLLGEQFSLASAELYRPSVPGTGPSTPPATPAVGPSAVTDLVAGPLSAREVSLSFSVPVMPGQPSRPARHYVIKQATSPLTAQTFGVARSLCGGVCAFSPGGIGARVTLTVTGLAANRVHHYALQPIGDFGAIGPVSNFAAARTYRDTIRPARVRGLSARGLAGKARLRFRAPGSDRGKGPPVGRFVIKQSRRPIRGGRAFRRARSLCRRVCRFSPRRVGSKLSLTVRGLCRPGKYHYAIRAKDEGGNLGPTARFRPVRVRRVGRCRAR